MDRCRFCGLPHQPCDAEYCYCGGNEKGEGTNPYCADFWEDWT